MLPTPSRFEQNWICTAQDHFGTLDTLRKTIQEYIAYNNRALLLYRTWPPWSDAKKQGQASNLLVVGSAAVPDVYLLSWDERYRAPTSYQSARVEWYWSSVSDSHSML
jgi:hypothetical protein